jgi:hypothetical protein
MALMRETLGSVICRSVKTNVELFNVYFYFFTNLKGKKCFVLNVFLVCPFGYLYFSYFPITPAPRYSRRN